MWNSRIYFCLCYNSFNKNFVIFYINRKFFYLYK
ncbi:unnamed protein product [Haemonchus placei]|uniref:Uncharacterized protein n=1 Tax=Haemonchus placei TaxID=6290 RepID=A0A0N4WQF9_HAEPC|nr:unnamed protein product [Haemonchus placei]